MRYRKLRILWTVFYGIACLLLIVLWVRSYWWWDTILGPISPTKTLIVFSSSGRLGVRLSPPMQVTGWKFIHHSVAKMLKEDEDELRGARNVVRFKPSWPVFGKCSDGNFRIAHGLVVLFFATLGIVTAPFIKWRFTLRTLLIATTLVAVVLGAIVYAAK